MPRDRANDRPGIHAQNITGAVEFHAARDRLSNGAVTFDVQLQLNGGPARACSRLRQPREFSPQERETLSLLARQVVAQLELRHQRMEMQLAVDRYQKLFDNTMDGVLQTRPGGEVLAANAKSVEEFRTGKDKAFNALVGQAMKATKGKANPGLVNELLKKKLSAGQAGS